MYSVHSVQRDNTQHAYSQHPFASTHCHRDKFHYGRRVEWRCAKEPICRAASFSLARRSR